MNSKEVKQRHEEQKHNIKALFLKGYTKEEIKVIIEKLYKQEIPMFNIARAIGEIK